MLWISVESDRRSGQQLENVTCNVIANVNPWEAAICPKQCTVRVCKASFYMNICMCRQIRFVRIWMRVHVIIVDMDDW